VRAEITPDANGGAGELAVEIDLAADGPDIEGMTTFTDPNALLIGELRRQASTGRTGRQTFV
jgi:hypothetical protein